jgi:hypothetical protein
MHSSWRIISRELHAPQNPERSNSTTITINASVTAAAAKRTVQLTPRLTHHSIAQPMTTAMMLSNVKGLPRCCLARTAGTAGLDPDRTADLHAGLRAVDPDKTGTIGRA